MAGRLLHLVEAATALYRFSESTPGTTNIISDDENSETRSAMTSPSRTSKGRTNTKIPKNCKSNNKSKHKPTEIEPGKNDGTSGRKVKDGNSYRSKRLCQMNDPQEMKRRRLLPPLDDKGGDGIFKPPPPETSTCSTEDDTMSWSSWYSEESMSSSSEVATSPAAKITSDPGCSDMVVLSCHGRNGGEGSAKSSRRGERADSPRSTGSCSRLKRVPSSTSLQDSRNKLIKHPRSNDVLCGKGPGVYRHSGNIAFRKFVQERKAEYILASDKGGKTKITNEVLEKLAQQDPPARFLERGANDQWFEIDGERQFIKTSQALREGASKMRAKAKMVLKALDSSSEGRTSLDTTDMSEPRMLRDALGIGGGEGAVGDLTPAQLKAHAEFVMSDVVRLVLSDDSNASSSSHAAKKIMADPAHEPDFAKAPKISQEHPDSEALSDDESILLNSFTPKSGPKTRINKPPIAETKMAVLTAPATSPLPVPQFQEPVASGLLQAAALSESVIVAAALQQAATVRKAAAQQSQAQILSRLFQQPLLTSIQQELDSSSFVAAFAVATALQKALSIAQHTPPQAALPSFVLPR